MRLYVAAALTLLAQGAVWAQDTAQNPFAGNPAAAAAAGKHVFDSTCTPCHGGAGMGTERAPALDSGRFKHGGDDFEIFQTIQKGVPGTQMPSFSSFSADQLWQLVTYVKSLSQSASGPGVIPPNADAGRGEQLFYGAGECTTCHEINGRGSILAADLSEIGKQTPARIKLAMEHPTDFRRMFMGPDSRYVDITLDDGKPLQGLLKNEDSLSIVLQTPDGGYRLLDRKHIRTLTNSSLPLGPQDLAKRFSADQLGDLLAFLAQQKQRAPTPIDAPATGVTFTRLKEADKEPNNWLTYWGSYRSEHFSELSQINRGNVGSLQARWAAPLPGDVPLESTPIVVDGVMYLAGAPGDVYAFDARSGLLIWRFHRQQQVVNPFQINPFNRGVAVLDQRVFVATLDNQLIALDARSGRVLWEKQIANTLEGYTMTGAPLTLGNQVIVGISGGEMGIRGFLDAYDVRDGHRLWRFNTVPGPGEPGHETWPGDSWKTGSGATWLTGSYDAQLNVLYWAVGNPGPDFDPEKRKGDNLYTDSVLALNPDTGKLLWYYQFSPHDTHDWDSNEDMILAEVPVAGQTRKVLMHADRNGFLYTLDRVTGKFISAVPFVRQTWNKGFDKKGRPIVDPASVATQQGHSIAPGVGGTNFQAPSYDPTRRVLFLNYLDAESTATYQPAEYKSGQVFTGSNFSHFRPPAQQPEHGVMALDVLTGRRLWTFPVTRLTLPAGVLATRGEVVFAATAEGNLLGLDAQSGQPLWHFQSNRSILASPMSYSVDGEQFVAISAGNTLYSFALPQAKDDLKITAIDVEGGFATLYVTPQGHSLLIDTGWPTNSAERIAATVKAAGLKGIDYLLITHYHVDHVGAAAQLMSLIPVGTVIDHGPNREELAPNANPKYLAMAPATLYPKYLEAIGQRPHRVLKPGDTLSIDAMKITAVDADGEVLNAPLGKGEPGANCAGATTNDNLGGEENPRSLGVLITWGNTRVLSMGDTTWNQENRLVCPKDLIGPVDLMFADNHGTENANSPQLLNTVQPRVVVFNNGAKKGAAAQSIQTALASPRIKGVWQIHRAEQHPDVNAPEANIANLSGDEDERHPLQIAVDREGGLEFTNPRTGTTTRYPVIK